MGLKKMFKNGDAKSVRRRRGGKDAKDGDTDDEVENNCDKVSPIGGLVYINWPSQSMIKYYFFIIPAVILYHPSF